MSENTDLGTLRVWLHGKITSTQDLLELWQQPKTRRGAMDIMQKENDLLMLKAIGNLLIEVHNARTNEGGNRQGTETGNRDAQQRISEVDEGREAPAGRGGTPDSVSQRGFAGF